MLTATFAGLAFDKQHMFNMGFLERNAACAAQWCCTTGRWPLLPLPLAHGLAVPLARDELAQVLGVRRGPALLPVELAWRWKVETSALGRPEARS